MLAALLCTRARRRIRVRIAGGPDRRDDVEIEIEHKKRTTDDEEEIMEVLTCFMQIRGRRWDR